MILFCNIDRNLFSNNFSLVVDNPIDGYILISKLALLGNSCRCLGSIGPLIDVINLIILLSSEEEELDASLLLLLLLLL